MKKNENHVKQGASTEPSPLFSELLARDSRKPSPALRAQGEHIAGGRDVPCSEYFDPEFAALEREHIWKKSWQFAAREEDMPEIGDRVTYDVGDMSFLIIRETADNFRAFYNSCLHRGTKLCTGHGGGDHIRCPFHGWSWNLDGTVNDIPGQWDFPTVKEGSHKLPEVMLGCWGGNIFINPDPQAKPLKNSLGILIEHFKDYDFENRWTALHVRKKIRGNWKLAMEAFLEGYHLSETHTQAQSFNGDSSTQYDIWEDEDAHISRLITPSAVPSPELGEMASARQAVIDMIKAVTPPGTDLPNFDNIEVLDRAFAAEWRRKLLTGMTGQDFSECSDTYMIDAIQYYMFPHFFPWYGEGVPLFYQFMPYGNDPNECVMQIRYMLPMPAGGQRPSSSPVVEFDFDEGFTESQAGFGLFNEVFDQDMGNIPNVQQGLKARGPDSPNVVFGLYMECRIKALHARIGEMIARGR